MFQFLWDGKPDKIKRNLIIQDYSKGGLKMVEIYSYINSLKIKWIKRILDKENKGSWKEIYNKELEKVGGELIFKSNIKENYVNQLKFKSKFLTEIINAWAKLNYKEVNVQEENISKQLLWNNSYIENNKRTFFYKDWFDLGISFIEHIYDYRIKSFLSFQNFKTVFNINNNDYLKYHTLINSIPNAWKNKLKSETIMGNDRMQYLINDAMDVKRKSNFLYAKQIIKIYEKVEVKSEKKWEATFGQINWKKTYSNAVNFTIDTKLRYFQYKYLMCILPSNSFLLKCKIANTSLCDFCNMHEETIVHLFWDCQISRIFWNRIENFLETKDLNVTVSYEIISLGMPILKQDNIIINFILILAKYFIFSSKYKKVIPNINQFIQYVYKRQEIEKIIALKKDKLASHNKKWAKLLLL